MNKKFAMTILSVASLFAASVASAATSDDARAVRDSVYRAKSVVDRAISASGHSRPTPGPAPSPGPSPWEVEELEVTESDDAALPIYQEASNNLYAAGSLADQAIIALSSGFNIQEGAFKFAQSCAKMGIARSQVARANLAAAQPPVGYLVQFGPELQEVVVELNALHQRCR